MVLTIFRQVYLESIQRKVISLHGPVLGLSQRSVLYTDTSNNAKGAGEDAYFHWLACLGASQQEGEIC